MESYLHRVVGLYASRAEADEARDLIVARGLSAIQVRVLTEESPVPGYDAKSDPDDVLTNLPRDGANSTTVATEAGSSASITVASSNLTLFIASPLLDTLHLIGWDARRGGLVSDLVGSKRGKRNLAALIKDALSSGLAVLVMNARSEAETALAQRVLNQHIDKPAVRVVKTLAEQETDFTAEGSPPPGKVLTSKPVSLSELGQVVPAQRPVS